jgi:hypothetical protein
MPNISSTGINPLTGKLFEIEEDQLFEQIAAQSATELNQVETTFRPTLGPPTKYLDHIHRLDKVHWGLLLPDPAGATSQQLALEGQHIQALQPLLDWRNVHNGKPVQTLTYYPGMSVDEFLYLYGGVERGAMQVEYVPYYLLIVASPERIPWEFQADLDGEYAVGRLWFDDPTDCAAYVERLLAYEKPDYQPSNGKEALLVGVRHEYDQATQSSAERLVLPVHQFLVEDQVETGVIPSLLLGDEPGRQATRANLLQRLSGQALDGSPARLPALIFTATHGLEFPTPNLLQPSLQGLPVFQEWPFESQVQPEHLLAPDQVAGLDLDGLLAFSFACFSAGAPKFQDWVHPLTGKGAQITEQPFVAALPQKLLARGALAFIGHVSKAWGFSFEGYSGDHQERAGNFTDVLYALLRGKPAGHAMESINLRALHLTKLVAQQLEKPAQANRGRLIGAWMARNDFQGYVVIGDPFVSLRVDKLV